MGIYDLGSIFDALDRRRSGYITREQLADFHEALHFTRINEQHIEAATRSICGDRDKGLIPKEQFFEVLQELDRRQQAEEQARWDFMALDGNGSCRLSVRDTLLLFRNTHGSDFSMVTWRRFLASREYPNIDVTFEEVKMWLCDLPDGDACDSNEFSTEEERLSSLSQQALHDQHEAYTRQKDGEGFQARERAEHEERTRRLARRKLNRWENEGLEAMLYDDGIDRGEDVPERVHQTIGVTELLNALENKYDILRRKLFMEMVRKHFGEAMWSSMSNGDQTETFEQVVMQEKQLRKLGTLKDNISSLKGHATTHQAAVPGMMGELAPKWDEQQKELSERKLHLKDEGKQDVEVEFLLRKEWDSKMKVATSCGDVLIQLAERYQEEKESLLVTLRPTDPNSAPTAQLTTEYCRLTRQHLTAELEETFYSSACSIGAAERPHPDFNDSLDLERLYQEMLSTSRIAQRKGRKLKLPDEVVLTGKSVIDKQVALVTEMTWKHAHEREVLINMLIGHESEFVKTAAKQLDKEERVRKLTNLRNQRTSWRNSSSDYKLSQKHEHIKLLQEGVGLHYENQKSIYAGASESQLHSLILAHLQLRQDHEFHILLNAISSKREKELENEAKSEFQSRKEEHLDNVAAAILGTFELTDDERPFIEALEAKYEMLRQVLLLHAMKAELGLGWDRMSIEEKQRKFMKIRKEETKLRQEGKTEELGTLISTFPDDFGSLRALMGENRGEYDQRQQSLFAKQEQAAFAGEDFSTIVSDEVPADEMKNTNHLADLVHRFYAEQDALITWLWSPEVKANQHARQRHLLQLKLEHRRAEKEEWFDLCGLSVGLRERTGAALEKRHPADQKRQLELARLRTDLRIQRLGMGRPHQKELDEYARPEIGDKLAWQEAYLKEMDKKFIDEREVMLAVLQDPSLEDLREAAKLMPDAEKCQRLSELRAKRYRLHLEKGSERDEVMSILEEAAAIRFVIKKARLQTEKGGQDVGNDEVIVLLLSELQEAQDREMAHTLNTFTKMDEAELQRAREYEISMRHWQACDNAIHVLTKYEGTAQDDELTKALDDKYDALKDKLLLDALMKQMGEGEWQLLSEQERQRRLMQLKLKERQLRRQGREDELAALLGETWAADEALRKLMGDNRSEYDRKLKERLARRQKRIEQGLDPDEEDGELEEEEGTEGSKNALEDLQHRYQQDKDALLARLRGLNGEFLSEKERQAELLRLRREALKAKREDNFDNAALLIGLAERQQAAANEKLKNDRERQEMLARQRLEALRKKRNQKDDTPSISVVTAGHSEMQMAVMQQLDKHHARESVLFAEMIDRCQGDEQLRASAMSELDRQDRLAELREMKNTTSPDDVKAHEAILQEACRLKVESRRAALIHKQDGGQSDVTPDDLVVSLLADLQEEQEKEAARYMKDMQEKSEEELINLQKQLIGEKQHVDGIVAVVMKTEDRGQSGDVLDALDSKYDALRDKLLMESLITQMGDAEWQKLSEQERQRRLLELKLEERKLRQEGKFDEAAALLGEAIRSHQALDQLMGENKAEQERKLKERLEARRKRKEQGMSDEECDRLEAEEEEEEKKRRNILLDLQHNYDKERDDLLRRLKDGDSQHEKERLRQLELARLRREQRRAKNEERFDAAAMVLGISREADQKQEADRRRQEQLAKERLEARRARQNKAAANQGAEEVTVPDDMNDLIGWQESLLKEVELKHQQEREALIQILESEASQAAAKYAETRSGEDREIALEELLLQEQKWRENGRIDDNVNRTLLEEGAGYRIAITRARLAEEGKPNSDEDVQVALLADLQQVQDAELQKVTDSTVSKNAEVIQQLKKAHSTSREHGWLECAAVVVFGAAVDTKTEQLSDEDQLIKALDQKYDAARDKLLMEALVKQVGEAEWQQMSERKRQMNLVKLRLEEKKLRSEGRYDEAALLLGQLSENEAELQRKLGDSQADQKRKLEERLQRRKEIMAERAAKGLSNEDTILDAIVEAEEEEHEKKQRKNILEELQHHYDDEKAALLAAMRQQDSRLASERQRQLEVARLRREEKRLKQEEKFDSAAILLSMAEQHDKKREENMALERDRQKELARERLEAKRKRLQEKQNLTTGITAEEMELKLKLEVEEDKLKEALEEAQIEREGLVALQEAILVEVERKQSRERDVLVDLMATALEENADVKNLNTEWRGLELEKLSKKHAEWTEKSKSAANSLKTSENPTKEARDAHLAEVAKGRTEQMKILTRAMALRMEAEAEFIRKLQPELLDEAVMDEMKVNLLTDLQQKQEAESRALEEVILKQDEGGLRRMRDGQREVVHEGWMDNLDRTIFTIPQTDDAEIAKETAAIANTDEVTKQMKEEFEKEKEELENKLKSSGEEANLDAALKNLESQQAAKIKAMDEAMDRQRRLAREKLEARRQARDNAAYEQDAASAMVQMVTQQDNAISERTGHEKNRQKNLMEQRLAERRDARRQKAEAESASRQEAAAAAVARPTSSDTAAFPPSLRRTATALSLRAVDVSEDQKQEIYTQLVREQTALHSKISQDQERQQEMLEKRLRDRKGRRQNEATALFTLGERQKTVLEQTQKEERERQMSLMKERVARVRYERTMTMKEKGASTAAKFDEMVEGDQETAHLSRDEKMELAAKQMQEQFQKQQKEMQQSRTDTTDGTDDSGAQGEPKASAPTSSGKLDPQDKMSILKQRRLAKKQQRQQQGAAISED